MKQQILKWLAIALVLAVGFLHLYLVPEQFGISRPMGVLFAADFVTALIAALLMFQEEMKGWLLALLVVALPVGLVSLAAEILLVILLILYRSLPRLSAAPLSRTASILLPVLTILTVFALSFGAYQADTRLTNFNRFSTTLITQKDLAEKYGLQVSLVGVTAMGGIVDVRIRILDPQKATPLLGDPKVMPGLLVDENNAQLIQAAHMGRHNHKLVTGGIYVVFFPNRSSSVHSGTQVSLVFGGLRLEPISAQ